MASGRPSIVKVCPQTFGPCLGLIWRLFGVFMTWVLEPSPKVEPKLERQPKVRLTAEACSRNIMSTESGSQKNNKRALVLRTPTHNQDPQIDRNSHIMRRSAGDFSLLPDVAGHPAECRVVFARLG